MGGSGISGLFHCSLSDGTGNCRVYQVKSCGKGDGKVRSCGKGAGKVRSCGKGDGKVVKETVKLDLR